MASRVPSFRFRSYDAASARTATRLASYAGAISALPALLAMLTALYAVLSPGVGISSGPDVVWSFAGFVLILGLSYGTWRGNRFTATSLLVLYVARQIVTYASVSSVSGVLVSGLFVVVLVQGVVGAFALHRLRPGDELDESLSALESGLNRPEVR